MRAAEYAAREQIEEDGLDPNGAEAKQIIERARNADDQEQRLGAELDDIIQREIDGLTAGEATLGMLVSSFANAYGRLVGSFAQSHGIDREEARKMAITSFNGWLNLTYRAMDAGVFMTHNNDTGKWHAGPGIKEISH